MDNQVFRELYQAARIKHEDAHHSFPFDNCHMPECEEAWETMNAPTRISDPKKQLETLVAHQHEFQVLLHALTGLTVRVSLNIHTADNSKSDLLHLFEASLLSPDFKRVSTSERTWIRHKDLAKTLAIFMPEGFDADDLYSEPEDDEGYNQAVENANACKHNDQGMQELDDRISDGPVTDYMP